MKQSGFYRSTFGNVRLWLSKLSTDGGRQLVVHEMSGGGGHVVQDMGPKVLVARATALFDYMIGDELSPKERLEEFRALVGTEQVLTHPTRGSYTARVGDFDEEIDDSGNLSAEVAFTATQDTLNVLPAGASSIPASGEGAVEAAADALKAERAELGLEDDGIADAAKADVDAWAASEDLNPRDVMTTTGKYTEQLGTAAEEHEFDLARWETFKRTVLLADAIRSAAESFTADTASTFLFRVGAPTALRSLIAAEYGAESADYYFQQVMRINDIACPGLLDEGMTLTFPAKKAVARNG